MSVARSSDCTQCGGEVSLRPYFYPQGWAVWAGRCHNCGSINTQASAAVRDEPGYDNGMLAADMLRGWEAKIGEADMAAQRRGPIRRGVPPEPGDLRHRCETCVHYADKGFDGGIGKYCLENKRFLSNRRGQRWLNKDSDCIHWCPVLPGDSQ